MNITDLFNLGNKYQQEGRVEMAVEMWKECEKIDTFFGPAHINLYNIYRSQNNIAQAKEQLVRFLNCPVTGYTLDIIPKIKQELGEIEKQLNPQPQPAK